MSSQQTKIYFQMPGNFHAWKVFYQTFLDKDEKHERNFGVSLKCDNHDVIQGQILTKF